MRVCLKWLGGTGEGWAKACLDGEPQAGACAGSVGPRVEEVAATERPKGAFVTTKARRSALHLPSKKGRSTKAQLARRREDESAWLFESSNQKFSQARETHSAVVLAKAGTHTLRLSDAEGVSNPAATIRSTITTVVMGPGLRRDDSWRVSAVPSPRAHACRSHR